MLRHIRSYLTAGVLNNGLFEASEEDTPQGGPLSPLLSRGGRPPQPAEVRRLLVAVTGSWHNPDGGGISR